MESEANVKKNVQNESSAEIRKLTCKYENNVDIEENTQHGSERVNMKYEI